MRIVLASLLCALGIVQTAADEAVADLQSTEWTCGDIVRLPADHIATILDRAELIGSAGARSFLVLDVPDIEDVMFGGTMLAVRGTQGWQSYAIESGGGIEGAKRSADGRHAVIVSMFGRGGPGADYTVVSTADGFTSFHCGALDFPDGLNQPTWRNEFLALDDFNGEPGGDIVLIGTVEREVDGEARTEHYRYESRDGGRNWSGPSPLPNAAGLAPGTFVEIGAADVAALKREFVAAQR